MVTKSLAPHYVISMVILMATLFWALWDEDFGQRPWKAFQHEWKDRYSTFLKSARSQSRDSQKEIQDTADYQKLKQEYENASQGAAPRSKEINEKLHDLSAQILAVQNVFTDRRAYVSASTYDVKTEKTCEAQHRTRRARADYTKESTTAEMPDGKK